MTESATSNHAIISGYLMKKKNAEGKKSFLVRSMPPRDASVCSLGNLFLVCITSFRYRISRVHPPGR